MKLQKLLNGTNPLLTLIYLIGVAEPALLAWRAWRPLRGAGDCGADAWRYGNTPPTRMSIPRSIQEIRRLL